MPYLNAQELSRLMGLAHRLADVAGAEILPHFRALRDVENKAGDDGFDPVTVADRNAEEAMRRLIEKERPGDGILGEEFPPKPSQSGLTWVLDPVDGTRGFIAGIPLWGTLIALNDGTRPVLGMVDKPYLKERYWGMANTASLTTPSDERRIRTRPCTRLEDAVLASTAPEIFPDADERHAFDTVSLAARLTRYGCDCYAYALLAAGHIDLVIESTLQPFDIQGPMAVIEAAGGVVTDWAGGPAHLGGQVIAAGDKRVHEQALKLLSPAAKGVGG